MLTVNSSLLISLQLSIQWYMYVDKKAQRTAVHRQQVTRHIHLHIKSQVVCLKPLMRGQETVFHHSSCLLYRLYGASAGLVYLPWHPAHTLIFPEMKTTKKLRNWCWLSEWHRKWGVWRRWWSSPYFC